MKAHWNRRKFIKATAAGSLGIGLAQELKRLTFLKLILRKISIGSRSWVLMAEAWIMCVRI